MCSDQITPRVTVRFTLQIEHIIHHCSVFFLTTSHLETAAHLRDTAGRHGYRRPTHEGQPDTQLETTAHPRDTAGRHGHGRPEEQGRRLGLREDAPRPLALLHLAHDLQHVRAHVWRG